ncbi:MAG: hypothetical protein ACK4UP_12710 [Spirosomataceae bacterium]
MKKWIFVAFFLICEIGHAQLPTKPKVVRQANEPWMAWQVKHVSEWISRFNCQTLPGGLAFNDSTRQLFPRQVYLRSLFDENDTRLLPNENGEYKEKIARFIAESCGEKPIYIPEKPQIQASVPVLFRYKSAQSTDTLVVDLEKVYRADGATFWEVTQVVLPQILYTDSVDVSIDTLSKRLYLPPNAHDLSFLPLFSFLTDSLTLARLAPSNGNKQPDLRRLETFLREKKVHVESILPPTLFIDTRRGWKIQLNEFIRTTENSGWLVTELYHQKVMEKEEELKKE